MNCKTCNKETSNPKFCSRSCSAILNGSLYPKRKKKPKKISPENMCTDCGRKLSRKIGNRKTNLCIYCLGARDIEAYGETLLKDATTEGNNRSARHKYQLVRSHAKRLVTAWGMKRECKCGYNKHVEICHIKPISKFEPTSKVSEINCKDNIVLLCPNCHWELDNLEG